VGQSIVRPKEHSARRAALTLQAQQRSIPFRYRRFGRHRAGRRKGGSVEVESAAEVCVLGARLLMGYVNARRQLVRRQHVYGLPSDERYAANLLASLPLQETAILCAQLNAIVSGIEIVSIRLGVRGLCECHCPPHVRQRQAQSREGERQEDRVRGFSRRSSFRATSIATSSVTYERSTSARETPSGSSRRAPAQSRSALGRSFRTNSRHPPRSFRSSWRTTCAWTARAPGCFSARR
jgi:hypothetical protein